MENREGAIPQDQTWLERLADQVTSLILDGTAPTGISGDVLLELIALVLGTMLAFLIGFLTQLVNNKRHLRRFLARDLEFAYQDLRRFADEGLRGRQAIREEAVSKLRRDFGDAKAQQVLTRRMDLRITFFEQKLDEFMQMFNDGGKVTPAMHEFWAKMTDEFVAVLDAIDPGRKASHKARGSVWRNLRGKGASESAQ